MTDTFSTTSTRIPRRNCLIYIQLFTKKHHYASPKLNINIHTTSSWGSYRRWLKRVLRRSTGSLTISGVGRNDALRVRISKNNIVVYRPSEGNTYCPPRPSDQNEINEHKKKLRQHKLGNRRTQHHRTIKCEIQRIRSLTITTTPKTDGAEEPICERLTENINVYFITSNI
jgi:hypothetical protein